MVKKYLGHIRADGGTGIAEPVGHAAQDGMDFGIDIHFGVGAHNAGSKKLGGIFPALLCGLTSMSVAGFTLMVTSGDLGIAD